MPVVINEFEVVEPADQRGSVLPVVVQAPPAPAPDLDLALALRRARALRVRAY